MLIPSHLHHSPAFAQLRLSHRAPALRESAGYGTAFHFVQLQPFATSSFADDFMTFDNNYCFLSGISASLYSSQNLHLLCSWE